MIQRILVGATSAVNLRNRLGNALSSARRSPPSNSLGGGDRLSDLVDGVLFGVALTGAMVVDHD
jgi:hypothetical protein